MLTLIHFVDHPTDKQYNANKYFDHTDYTYVAVFMEAKKNFFHKGSKLWLSLSEFSYFW